MITSENAAIVGVPFTSETARIAGLKGGSMPKPWLRKAQLSPDEKTRTDAVRRQLRLIREQLAYTRRLLNEDQGVYCVECKRGSIMPHHRAQLLKALDSLCERELDLLGIPGRGSRKPVPERSRPARPESPEIP